VGSVHRELAIAGADSTATVATEAIAEADEVAMSPATAALVEPALRGASKEGTILLARDPELPPVPPPPFETGSVDLARLLPAEYTAELRGDPEDPEHRHVAVAFVEICDTDDVLRDEGADALAEALDERISGIQEACLEHGVTFAQTDISKNGVKAILLTGAPRSAAGDEEELLLRAARAIADEPGKLPVRIGINSGRIFAGIVGPPSRRTYTFYGDTINTAARIMVRATHGQVLLADDVLERARTRYATVRVEPFQAKGKAEPVRASELGAPVGMKIPEASGPLVGRSLETDTLLGLLEAARGGASASVLITGEPGVGKTRLVAELGTRAIGARWFRIQCEQADTSHAYRIAGAIVRAALGASPGEEDTAVEQRLREAVATHTPELAPWLPLLGIALGIELDPTPETRRLEARFVPERMAESVAVLLSRVVAQPALVTIDDSQWLDEASRYLLGHVAASTPSAPWLWVATRRDAGPPPPPPAPSGART
jgi:class 3 adenylate cyclase